MGSVCRKTVKICAATVATATENIATAYRELADCFDSHGGGLDFGIVFPRPAYVLFKPMPAKNIRRPTAETRAAVSVIRGAKSSWQRGQTRLTFGREIGNSIAASARAPKVNLLSTAETL